MPFSWTPSTGLNDTSAFPGPDKNFRAHLQSLLQQIPDYVDATKANKTQDILTPTLVNGWTNLGAPYETAKYWKDDFGIVHLDGTIQNGTSATIFTLPIGYRPLGTLYFPNMFVNGSSAWDNGMLNITSSGVVQHMNVPVGNSQSLNGITFLAEQ